MFLSFFFFFVQTKISLVFEGCMQSHRHHGTPQSRLGRFDVYVNPRGLNRLLTQHMYRLSLRCTDFATAATADSAWEPANVTLLYTSDMYGQQISRASYDAGVTKPHCTTPTRTRVQVTTQYGTNTGHVIDRTCMHAAGGQVAGVLRTHRAQLPPDA